MSINVNTIIPLSYNLADGRRKYVLFCGSGVSKDAEIPTGWGILLETLRLLRAQEDDKPEEYSDEQMEAYYHEKYADATYFDIINGLFPSQEEQREFLKKFFDGRSPGTTHKLIVEWIKRDLVRFIVTTNFDTLLEQALDDAGLRGKYSVISTEEQVLSSKPWSHVEDCRIYKIHGTIEQGKIRNTKKDLAELDPNIKKDTLDITERHGVIVLGYSGSDKGVMDVFENRKFKGYTLYWTTHSEKISDDVKSLVKRQDGLFIPIKNASDFLDEVLNRVEIARRGIEQTTEAVARERFENLLRTGSEIEILHRIEAERRRLVDSLNEILTKVDENDYKSLWEGYLQIFDRSIVFFQLVDQVSKYKTRYWDYITPIFEEIHSLNEHGDRDGKNGLINYYFFTLIEVIGGILVKNNSYKLLNSMLKIRRLSRRKDAMVPILDWNIQDTFIEVKNQEEAKEGGSVWIVPKFHYLLQLLEASESKLGFEIKNWMREVDLLLYSFTVAYPRGRFSEYWYPRAAVYLQFGTTDTLKRIQLDKEFGEKVARELFEKDYDELLRVLKEAKEIFDKDIRQRLRGASRGNPFSDFDSPP